MNVLEELTRLPERRAPILWFVAGWLVLVLAPFAIFGENWGMIFYYLTLPFSELFNTYYEDWGIIPYAILVAVIDVGVVTFFWLLIYNSTRIIRTEKQDSGPKVKM